MPQLKKLIISTFAAAVICCSAFGQELKPGDVIWEFHVSDNETFLTSSLDYDDNVYCTASENNDGHLGMKLYAVDGKTGLNKWTVPLVDDYFWRNASIGTDNTIYVVDDGKVLALDNKTGKEKWTKRSGAYSNISIDADGTIYCSTYSNKVLAINSVTGKKEWGLDLPGEGFQGSMVDNSNIYFYEPSQGRIAAIDKKSEKKIWEFTNGRPTGAGGKNWNLIPSIGVNNEIFAYTNILDSVTGKIKRERDFGLAKEFGRSARPPCSFVIGPNNITYGAPLHKSSAKKTVGGVIAFDENSQTVKFEIQEKKLILLPPLIDDNGCIYVTSSAGIMAMDSVSGDLVWEYEITSEPYAYWNYKPAIGSNGYLYAGLGNKLVALKTSSTGTANSAWPMPDQNPQRTGRAPSPVADKIKINTFSKSDSPFTISFESKAGATYVIEASHDLKKWGEIGEAQGTGSSVEFTDWREALFQKQYYRVKLVE